MKTLSQKGCATLIETLQERAMRAISRPWAAPAA